MKSRRGFTLIEVLIALVILTIVVLGLGKFVGSFLHVVGVSTLKTVATEVANAQMNQIEMDPTYPLPAASYVGPVTGFPGYASMKRVTVFNRINTAGRDYTVITVQVTEPTMKDTVNVTAVVAKP